MLNPSINDDTYLIHGINTADKGEDTVLKTVSYLENETEGVVKNHPYDWLFAIGAVFKNKGIAKRLTHDIMVSSGTGQTFAVGHSNGCAIILRAAENGTTFDRVLLINPALKRNTIFPKTIKSAIVVYTKHDVPTRIARVCDMIPLLSLFVPNAWGAMGAKGPNYIRMNDLAINMSNHLDGHSDLFEDKKMARFMPHLAKLLYSPRLHDTWKDVGRWLF